MPLDRSPVRKDDVPQTPAPDAHSGRATGTVPRTELPATPKGILKASKAELIDTLYKLRVHLGKPTDAATKAKYDSWTKDKLADEYYRLRTMAEMGQVPPAPTPTPATTPPPATDLTQLLMHLDRQRREDLERAQERAEEQRRADRRRAEEQRLLDQERAEEQRLRAEEQADKRLAAILESLRIPGAAPAGGAPEANPAPARVPAAQAAAHQRGPRTFDYSTVMQLTQDSTYRDFKDWQETWTNNARVKQFASFDRETQVYAIVSAAGPHASKILKTHLGIDLDAPATTADIVLNGLRTYYRDQRSVVVDRVAFRKCKQKATETFDEFRFRLVDMADDADLCEHCRDTQVVTQIIYGLRGEKVKNELLQKRTFPTLEDTVQLCRAFEAADRNQAKLEGREVSRVSAYKQEKNRTQQKEAGSRSRSRDRSVPQGQKCGNCGRNQHKSRDDCPAQGVECNGCHKKGHYEKVCRSKAKSDTNKNSTRTQSSLGDPIKSVLCASVTNPEDEDPLCSVDTVSVEIKTNDGSKRLGQIQATPDTGAAANILAKKDYVRLGRDVSMLRRPGTVLNAYNGLNISLIGREILTVRLGNRSTTRTFFITDEGKGSILSKATSQALGLLPTDFPSQIPDHSVSMVAKPKHTPDTIRAEILSEYADVFDEETEVLPTMNGDPIHIELREDAKPFQVNGPRPVPLPLRNAAKGLIEDLQQRGIISPVQEPTEWLHPATFVPKKPGSDKLRLCVDLRKLNTYV